MWLELLENLTYFDLKRCTRVSRRFKLLTGAASLDNALFRSSATGNVIPNTESSSNSSQLQPQMHPALTTIRVNRPAKGLRDVQITRLYGSRPAYITTTAVSLELAVTPPVTELVIQLFHLELAANHDVHVRNERGVTVEDAVTDVLVEMRRLRIFNSPHWGGSVWSAEGLRMEGEVAWMELFKNRSDPGWMRSSIYDDFE